MYEKEYSSRQNVNGEAHLTLARAAGSVSKENGPDSRRGSARRYANITAEAAPLDNMSYLTYTSPR